jgi:hypothetical protein
MKGRMIVVVGFAFALGGCDVVRAMLPRQGTTYADARLAISRCGITPDSITWSVSADGTLAFGRRSADALPITDAQNACLTRWVETNRIKVAFIGWETNAPDVR